MYQCTKNDKQKNENVKKQNERRQGKKNIYLFAYLFIFVGQECEQLNPIALHMLFDVCIAFNGLF